MNISSAAESNPFSVSTCLVPMKLILISDVCCQSPASFPSSDDMEMCSLKVLELEGSPSRMLLRLMGERGCTTGHLIDYLQTLGNSEAVQCLKPSGTVKPPPARACYYVVEYPNEADLCSLWCIFSLKGNLWLTSWYLSDTYNTLPGQFTVIATHYTSLSLQTRFNQFGFLKEETYDHVFTPELHYW